MSKETQPAEKSFAKRKRYRSLMAKGLWVRDFLHRRWFVSGSWFLFVLSLSLPSYRLIWYPRRSMWNWESPILGRRSERHGPLKIKKKTEELREQAAARVVEENKDKLEYQTISIEAGVEAGARYNKIVAVFEEYRTLTQPQMEEGALPEPDAEPDSIRMRFAPPFVRNSKK